MGEYTRFRFSYVRVSRIREGFNVNIILGSVMCEHVKWGLDSPLGRTGPFPTPQEMVYNVKIVHCVECTVLIRCRVYITHILYRIPSMHCAMCTAHTRCVVC